MSNTDTKDSAYKKWSSIKNRIRGSWKKGNESYINCSISKEWENFETFLAWYESNYVEGWHIDKDLFGWDVKIYSEDTCCFIPPRLNTFMVNLRDLFSGKFNGIYFRERDGVFVATVSNTSKNKIHLGHFNTREDAERAYVKGKFSVLDSIVEDYYTVLSDKILKGVQDLKHKILLRYNLQIEDLSKVDESKIKRARKSIIVDGEHILLTDVSANIGMNYRHLHSLIFLKKWSLEKVFSKYDKSCMYAECKSLEVNYD